MDFITHLPVTIRGFNAITTVVDRFSRRVHFIASKDSDTATDTANTFFREIFRLHGLTDSIISDRDPKFTSNFWKSLMNLCDVKLRLSTSYHPQTDGYSEIMNRMIENYLRCYCSLNQSEWDVLLPSAEFAFNSSRLDATGYTPFELDIGWTPSSPLDRMGPKPKTDLPSVEDLRASLESSFKDAHFSHRLAQARQSAYNSQKCRPHSYKVGDSVWLDKRFFTDPVYKLQTSKKLSARRFGPFKILELIGRNAVNVQFPDSIRAHNVVHVEHTKPHHQQPTEISVPRPSPALLHTDDNGHQVIEIGEILSHRKRGRGYQFLALPSNAPTHEAQWQPLRDFLDSDGTITQALHSYIVSNHLLPNLH